MENNSENVFRVSIAGRYYDIPMQSISTQTLHKLEALADNNHTINPRDLLKAFLESSEITCFLEENIKNTLHKLESYPKNT